MRLSDLIKEAERLIELHGDVKLVVFKDNECLDANSLSYVDYADAVCLGSVLSYRWCVVDNFKLTGFYYSDEEIILSFPTVKDTPSISKRMVFRFKGESFYCDNVVLQVYKGIATIKGRVISRC